MLVLVWKCLWFPDNHGLIKLVMKHELSKQGIGWSELLASNDFENTDEVTEDSMEHVSRNISQEIVEKQEIFEKPKQGNK